MYNTNYKVVPLDLQKQVCLDSELEHILHFIQASIFLK